MIIPLSQISEDILAAIIKEFVLREGTDYGLEERGFERKLKDVKAQLDSGEAVLVYSELHETVNIMSAEAFKNAPEEAPQQELE